MTKIKCPHDSCNKEFEKPIMVTNFSATPKNETYYACPYCLTKIDNTTNACSCTPDAAEPLVAVSESKKLEETSMASLTDTMKKIGTLEKEKADLLAELDELRTGAMQKICTLNEEVAALREEAQILKKLTEP